MEIEGGGHGWEGQKRRKHQGPSPTPSSVARGDTISEEEDARARVRAPMPLGSADEPQEDLENYIVSNEEFQRCLAVLSTRRPPVTIVGPRLDDEQQLKVYERRVLYRIRASKLAEGVCRDELDDVTLRKEYSPEVLEEMYYNGIGDYHVHDEASTFGWYFDRGYSVYSYLSILQLIYTRKDFSVVYVS